MYVCMYVCMYMIGWLVGWIVRNVHEHIGNFRPAIGITYIRMYIYIYRFTISW